MAFEFFCRTLLPLLPGRSLIGALWIEILPSSKIRLICQVFAMLPNGSFNPVVQCLVVMSWFEGNHGFLQSLRESLEEFATYHPLLLVVACEFC